MINVPADTFAHSLRKIVLTFHLTCALISTVFALSMIQFFVIVARRGRLWTGEVVTKNGHFHEIIGYDHESVSHDPCPPEKIASHEREIEISPDVLVSSGTHSGADDEHPLTISPTQRILKRTREDSQYF